jgi:hypothetical protein
MGLSPTVGKNVVYAKPAASAQRRLVGDHYLAGGTLESETDIHRKMMLPGNDLGDSYNPVSQANVNVRPANEIYQPSSA